MTRAPPDCEASFGGAVYKVSRRAQVAGEIRIARHRFKSSRSSAIAVLANQRIDGCVFAELLYAGREDDQLRTLGQRHAGTIDRLVAQPRAVKLMRIEINDSLPDRPVQSLELHFTAY